MYGILDSWSCQFLICTSSSFQSRLLRLVTQFTKLTDQFSNVTLPFGFCRNLFLLGVWSNFLGAKTLSFKYQLSLSNCQPKAFSLAHSTVFKKKQLGFLFLLLQFYENLHQRYRCGKHFEYVQCNLSQLTSFCS